jgi:hypothetical protein
MGRLLLHPKEPAGKAEPPTLLPSPNHPFDAACGTELVASPSGMSTSPSLFAPPGSESAVRLKTPSAATAIARLIGLLTIAWTYFAYNDLRWLLHIHAVHVLHSLGPFKFSYYSYLACNIANVAVSIAAVCVFVFFPSWLLGTLTPASRRPRPLNPACFTAGIMVGLSLLVLGGYTIFSNILWTVYRSGQNAGWQLDMALAVLVVAAGVFLCRRVLAGRALST